MFWIYTDKVQLENICVPHVCCVMNMLCNRPKVTLKATGGPDVGQLMKMGHHSPMKMMDGACARAWANRSLTRAGPMPTNTSMKSEPLMDRKGTLASPAAALASSVLPVPGGPTSRAPFGIFAPRSLYRLGPLRKLTNSITSCFASSQPATSLNMILFLAFLSRTVTCINIARA